MAAALGAFPTEIVAVIAELLDASHPPSLVAFAQISKHHYAISSRFLFRTIRMNLGRAEKPEWLCREVNKWEAILLRNHAFASVRRLILCSADVRRGMPDNSYLALEQCERDDDPAHLRSCWDALDAGWLPAGTASEPRSPSLHNEEWQSAVHLVARLRGLTDIIYACAAQFPSCLLETLRLELPHCRLHHFTFRLRDPNDAYERALATAPRLYSIGDLDYVDDRAGRILARPHAPRLTNVFVWASSRTLHDVAASNHQPLESAGRDHVAALKHIELGRPADLRGPEFLSDFVIVARIAFNDFSALRVLKLNATIDCETLPPPEDFPSLVTLALTCTRDPTASSYWTAALAFMRNLPRLTTLQLTEWNRSASVVPGLSPNLRNLQLSTRPDQDATPLLCDHIHQLATLCPHLEELAIETRRSRDDAAEVALYRALGRLPRLRRLTLDLDVSPPRIVQVADGDGTVHLAALIEPWFDAWDADYLQEMETVPVSYPPLSLHRKGHVLDIFVNSAVDERLARSIFAVVEGAKRTIAGGGVMPLEHLQVGASSVPGVPRRDFRVFAWRELTPYLHEALGRNWSVTRSVRDDERDVLHVREVCYRCRCVAGGKPESRCRMMKWREARGADRETMELVSAGGPFAEVWSRLWPDKGDGRAWLDSWESWPLELEESEGQ